MRKINLIVVHCTATKEGKHVTVEDIDKQHKAQGWSCIGYHYVVYLDGSVHVGRPVEQVGAHAGKAYNPNSIGVCYVGGLDTQGKPADTRTEAQKKALSDFLWQLHKKYPSAAFCGHRDLSPDKNGDGVISKGEWVKACPCFDVSREYPALPQLNRRVLL